MAEEHLIQLSKELPRAAINKVVEHIIPHGIKKDSSLELKIVLKETALHVMGLSCFLMLANRWYGRLSPGGLDRYTKKRDQQLQIANVRHEPLALVFFEISVQRFRP